MKCQMVKKWNQLARQMNDRVGGTWRRLQPLFCKFNTVFLFTVTRSHSESRDFLSFRPKRCNMCDFLLQRLKNNNRNYELNVTCKRAWTRHGSKRLFCVLTPTFSYCYQLPVQTASCLANWADKLMAAAVSCYSGDVLQRLFFLQTTVIQCQ